MRAIRGLLFDKDGTLIDFYQTWGAAYRAVTETIAAIAGDPGLAPRLLVAGGYDAATGTLAPESPLACGTNDEIASLWARDPAVARIPDMRARMLETLHGFAATPVPVTDLPGLFARLRGRGLQLGVATNDHTVPARTTLRALEVDHLLDFVAGADAGFGGKPGAGMLVGFCRATGLDASEVAMIGDSVADIAMARAGEAGLAVGVLTGVTPRLLLEDVADHVIDSIAELEGLLDRVALA
jgi:phosphoglycolate phosphatase